MPFERKKNVTVKDYYNIIHVSYSTTWYTVYTYNLTSSNVFQLFKHSNDRSNEYFTR